MSENTDTQHQPALRLQQVAAGYPDKPVFGDLSFDLAAGEIGCLLGASGCGKTTALRVIAGFEPIQAGTIRLQGREIASARHAVPAEKRAIGMVFQDYALFPHLSVSANIGFGLQKDLRDRSQRTRRISQLLELMGLADYAEAFPHELSGGQQQRVALARALAPKPALILLDEPFSNLDSELRERLGSQVRQWLKSQGTTALLVTHDQREAFAMADRVGLLQAGKLKQWDTPYNLYHRPADRYVANFVGEGVFIPGTVGEDGRVSLEAGRTLGKPVTALNPGTAVEVLIRPDDVLHDDQSAVTARVVSRAFRGAEFLYTLELPSGARVLSLVPSHHDHAVGSDIGIHLEMNHVIAFPKN